MLLVQKMFFFLSHTRNCLKATDQSYNVQLFILGLPSKYIEYTSNLKNTIIKAIQSFTLEKDEGRFMIEVEILLYFITR